MTLWDMGGSPHTIAATARARSGLDTVTPAGKLKWKWFWGRAATRLTTSRVTAACFEHKAALPVDTGPPGSMPPGPAVRGLDGWVALVVVATWLPQPATTVAAAAAAAMSSPARVRRPERVTGTPMVVSVPVHVARDQAGKQCAQGTERRPGPFSALDYKNFDV